jgi:hypothetical protein
MKPRSTNTSLNAISRRAFIYCATIGAVALKLVSAHRRNALWIPSYYALSSKPACNQWRSAGIAMSLNVSRPC